MPLTDRKRKFLETLYRTSAADSSKVAIEQEGYGDALYKFHFVYPSIGKCHVFVDKDGELKIKKGAAVVEVLREDDPIFLDVISRGPAIAAKLTSLPADKKTFFTPATYLYDVSPKDSESESRVKRNTGLARVFGGLAGGGGDKRRALGRQDGFTVTHFFSHKGREYNGFTIGQSGEINSLQDFSSSTGFFPEYDRITMTPEMTAKIQEARRVIGIRNILEYADDAFVSKTSVDAQTVRVALPRLTLPNGVVIVGIAEKPYKETVYGHTSDQTEIVFVDDKGNKVHLETLAASMTDVQTIAFIRDVRSAIDRERPPQASVAAVATSAVASAPATKKVTTQTVARAVDSGPPLRSVPPAIPSAARAVASSTQAISQPAVTVSAAPVIAPAAISVSVQASVAAINPLTTSIALPSPSPLVTSATHVVSRQSKTQPRYDSKIRVTPGVYEDDSPKQTKQNIEDTMLDILAVMAKKHGLNPPQVKEIILLAKDRGGVANAFSTDGSFKKQFVTEAELKAKATLDTIDPAVAIAFSADFQKSCKACGIYSSNGNAARLVDVPKDLEDAVAKAATRKYEGRPRDAEEMLKERAAQVKSFESFAQRLGGRGAGA